MGYGIKIKKSTIQLDNAQQKQAYQAWHAFFERVVNSNQIATLWIKIVADECIVCKSFSEILCAIGMEHKQNSKNLKIVKYERKLGDQLELFKEIAHIISPGQYIVWRGEDKDVWAWIFDGSQVLSVEKKDFENQLKIVQDKVNLREKINCLPTENSFSMKPKI